VVGLRAQMYAEPRRPSAKREKQKGKRGIDREENDTPCGGLQRIFESIEGNEATFACLELGGDGGY